MRDSYEQGDTLLTSIFRLVGGTSIDVKLETPDQKGVTVLKKEGKLRGLVLRGGGEAQRDGIPGIERKLGILGTAALGEGMEEPYQIGVENMTINELSSSINYYYDIHTGLEVLSLGYDNVFSVADFDRPGPMKACWDQDRFCVGTLKDPNGYLRLMAGVFTETKAVLGLSNPDGGTGAVDLGIFSLDYLTPEQREEFAERDRRIVEHRHALLTNLATRDGSRQTDMPSAATVAEPANETLVA